MTRSHVEWSRRLLDKEEMRFPKLFHYSAHPIKKIVQKKHYKLLCKEVYAAPGKPFGFWVSVLNDWARWCRGERFFLEGLKYQYRIHLKKDANILFLHDLESFDKFCEEYGWDRWNVRESRLSLGIIMKTCEGNALKDIKRMIEGPYNSEIHWDRVKQKYQSIIIPYFNQRRLMCASQWYYAWDCASGVIWDTSCIESFELYQINF